MKNVFSPQEKNNRTNRKSRSIRKSILLDQEGRLISCQISSSRFSAGWFKLKAVFMKRIRYSKYVPDPAGEMSMDDLLSALSAYLLQSGFQNYMYYDMPGEQTL